VILQKDGRLQTEIQKHGCYYMSLLWYANKFTNMSLSVELIDAALFKRFVINEWMSEGAYILDPEAILNWCGVKCYYTNKHEDPDVICGPTEFEILYWRHPEVGGHFTAGDGKGRVTYDPYGVSKAASEGTLMSKRIFRRTE